MTDFSREEPTTRRTNPRLHAVEPASSSEPISDHELLGRVMASCARTEAESKNMRIELGTLSREVGALRRDVEQDRTHSIRATSKATANHTSTRTAALAGLLFALWEYASPVLHELLKLVHK